MKLKCVYSDLIDFREKETYNAACIGVDSFLIESKDGDTYYAEGVYGKTIRIDEHETYFISEV